MARTQRLEARLTPGQRQQIELGARLVAEPVSSFMVIAAVERADSIVSERAVTRVEADYFDRLLDSLDQPDSAPGLRAAGRRTRNNPRIGTDLGAAD